MNQLYPGHRKSFGSFIVDGRGTILGFDESMEALTSWPAVEMVGHNKNAALAYDGERVDASPLVAPPLYEEDIPIEAQRRTMKLTLHCRDDRKLAVEARLDPLNGMGERALVTILRVLSRASRAAAVKATDRRDALTALPNREAFVGELSAAFDSASQRAKPLSLILLDVDGLRDINDVKGRKAGDDVLKRLAGILRVSVADERQIARLGDDDFALIVADGGRGEARELAASVRSTVERFPFFADEPDGPPVTLSLGAASFPADADNGKELIDRARDALQEARSLGRNRVWCYLRRPRVPVQVPVYYDGADPLLVGYSRDLSPSGLFVQTTEQIDVGMRCALTFPLPGQETKVHVVGRVVRTVMPVTIDENESRIPGVGIEFERFGGKSDQRAIDTFLHGCENLTLRPETGPLSF